MDDGADVIGVLHSARREQLGEIIAGTEETTTGVIRLKALEADGKLGFPIIAVNDAKTKHLFDNRYGTGNRRSTASCARRTSCSPGGASWSPATAGQAAASRCAREASVRT